MAFKKLDTDFGFADLALASSLKHNRSLKLMENINASIDWPKIEAILMDNYTAGTSIEGPRPIHHYCCSNASWSKNGFVSIPILNWKTRLMIVYLLKSF